MKFVLAFVALAAAADGDSKAKCAADDKCTETTDSCVQRTSADADRKKKLTEAGKTCEATADCGDAKAVEVDGVKEHWECAKAADDAKKDDAATGAMATLSAGVALAGAILIQ